MLERKTAVSSNVLKILQKAKHPLSVADITDLLNKKKLRPNKTTIYRILEKLMQKKAVSEVSVRNGASYYEMSRGHHHHHFICNECDTVFCLDVCLVDEHRINLSSLLPTAQFKIQFHDFNLYGVCEPCAAR